VERIAFRNREFSPSAYFDRIQKGGDDDCWPWLGPKLPSGYGFLKVPRTDGGGNQTSISAHQMAVLLDGRDIPEGMEVDHTCERRDCGNPRHLDVITHAENMQRMSVRNPRPIVHGRASSYTHGTCRCDLCTDAAMDAQRRRRARKLATM